MKKIIFLCCLLAGLAAAFVCCAAEPDPIPVTFKKAGGGQYIYCNNPERIGESDLSTDENPTPSYMMKCDRLGENTYSVFFCFYNWTDFDVEPDLEWLSADGAEIRIDSAAYCLPVGTEYFDCVGAWADFLNLPIRTVNGYQQYVPFGRQEFPQTLTLEPGESAWAHRYCYNYSAVPSRVSFLMLLKFTVLSGSVDVNFAALKSYPPVGDRSHHVASAAPGFYYQDSSIKGIEPKSLPMVESTLNVTLNDEIADGTSLPVKIFNQYYPEGNVMPYWMTNINPNKDDYLYSKGIAVSSDMLSFQYKDDTKLRYYGKKVAPGKRNNIWIFDIYHHDTAKYKEEMPWKEDNYIPNDYNGATQDINNLLDTRWELNLGNFGVTNRYHLNIKNSGNRTRILNYYLETSLSSNVVLVRDEAGRLLNPYTLSTENAFGLSKGMNNNKVNTCLFSVSVAPGQTVRYLLDVILPTNCYGGMVNALKVENRKGLMPIEGPELPEFADEFPLSNVLFDGRESLQWQGDTLYRLDRDNVWRPLPVPDETRALLLPQWDNSQIVRTDWGYAVRFCGWDNGKEWCADAPSALHRVLFFDSDFKPISEYPCSAYVTQLAADGNTVMFRAGEDFRTTDGKTVTKFKTNATFPETNGRYTVRRKGATLFYSENGKAYPIVLPEARILGDIKGTDGLFYYVNSFKTYFSDSATPNILSVSSDGVRWTDLTLPNTFLELQKVLYLNGKVWVDGRYQTVVLDYEPQEEIKLLFDGKVRCFQTEPQTRNDRLMIPAREVFSLLNAKIEWNGETEEITVSDRNRNTAVFRIGAETAVVNGTELPLDAPAYLIDNGISMLPLRFLTEQFGYRVVWEEERNILRIDQPL